MGKPIGWKWLDVVRRGFYLKTSDGNFIARLSHGAKKSDKATMEAAPLMRDALVECMTVFGDNFLNSFEMHVSDEGAVTIQEAINAIETIQALREEESNER